MLRGSKSSGRRHAVRISIRKKSDADFLVEFDPDSRLRPFHRYFDLIDALRNTLGRPVDLVEFHAVHNPYLRAAINKSRELVYES